MNCENSRSWFIDIIEDKESVNPQIKQDFFNHLKECKNCSTEFAGFKELLEKIQNIKQVEADNDLYNSFLAKLELEKINRNKKMNLKNFYYNGFRVAAGILLFITGSFFGFYFSQINNNPKHTEEILELKHSYTALILKEQTISAKIQAISYFNGETIIDDDFLNILAGILNNDDNVNVRLAAAKALFKYSNQEKVKAILIESLKNQAEPMVQIELINFIVQIHEKQAVESLLKIVNNENANNIVKQYAQNGLKRLI
ncbi:MAG: HEAT repeat domain-containing protein [Bacteroidales bacterium]|nr:HEAT repeat domain-containing protein [Bacteroidales bacterium]